MKIPSLFSKTPRHKRFSFAPRFYNEEEYERKEREQRIRKELLRQKEQGNDPAAAEGGDASEYQYGARIAGSFRSARRPASRQSNPSSLVIRFVLVIFLSVWVIAYMQYGNVAFYGLLLIIPVYLFVRRNNTNRNRR